MYPCRHISVQNMVCINIPLLLWYTWIYQYYHDIHGYNVSMHAGIYLCYIHVCKLLSMVYLDIPVLPWYTWIQCIHADTYQYRTWYALIYHYCYGIHGYTSTTMVYMDTMYPCMQVYICAIYMYVCYCPWYTLI